MSKLSFCQNGYPKRIVYAGDTVVCITDAQLVKINRVRMVSEYLQEYSDSLKEDNLKLLEIYRLQKEAFNSSQEESRILEQLNQNLRYEVGLLSAELEKQKTKKRRKNLELWVWRIGAIVGGYFLLK